MVAIRHVLKVACEYFAVKIHCGASVVLALRMIQTLLTSMLWGALRTYYPRYHSAFWISLPQASQNIRSFVLGKPVCRAAPSGICVYSLRLEVDSLPAEGCLKSQPYSISESKSFRCANA